MTTVRNTRSRWEYPLRAVNPAPRLPNRHGACLRATTHRQAKDAKLNTPFEQRSRSTDSPQESGFAFFFEEIEASYSCPPWPDWRHDGSCSVRIGVGTGRSGRGIDFVIPGGRSHVDAIECRWAPAQFAPVALTAFHSYYPRGTNVLVNLDLDLAMWVDQLQQTESLLAAAFYAERHPHSLNVSDAGSDLRVQIQTDPRYAAFVDRATPRDLLWIRLPVAWEGGRKGDVGSKAH